MDNIPVYSVLSGAANEKQLFENLQANSITLDQEDIHRMKKLAVTPEVFWTERKQLSWN